MSDYGLLIGFFGIVVGAGITFVAEVIVLKSRMRFDMSIAIREAFIIMNDNLVVEQTKLLDFYSDSDKNASVKNIILMRKQHLKIMEIYKSYRIHLGDCKAYEFNSAVYKYYFEKAISYSDNNARESKVPRSDYENSFTALRDSLGLMINDVRFELVKINSLRKITKSDKQYKLSEYKRYSDHLIILVDEDLNLEISTFKIDELNNEDLLYRATKVLVKREGLFRVEYKRKVK